MVPSRVERGELRAPDRGADHVGGALLPALGPVSIALLAGRLGERLHKMLDLDLRRPHLLFAGSGLRLSFEGARDAPGDFAIVRGEAELKRVRVASHGFEGNRGVPHAPSLLDVGPAYRRGAVRASAIEAGFRALFRRGLVSDLLNEGRPEATG